MNVETKHRVDIAIIGGGVAGCTAAIALAKNNSVLLIDKLNEPVDRIGECLAPAARRILKQLNLLEGMDKMPFGGHLKNKGTQSYWGSPHMQVADQLRNPDGFGWHLNRKAFEEYLRDSALQSGVTCLWGNKLHTSRYENSRWEITAQSTDELAELKTRHISSNFVIDASGRQSHFAKKLGHEREHHDKLIACWATLPDVEENKLGIISACEEGWWYSAALPGAKRVVAFHSDSDLVERNTLKNAEQFIARAQGNTEMKRLLKNHSDTIQFHGTVAANSTRLNQVAGRQWAALGDSAISFDPLSSQGMFNAMANAMQLSALLVETDVIHNPETTNTDRFCSSYTKQIDEVWNHYLKHKTLFYGAERRWQNSAFWKRRQ